MCVTLYVCDYHFFSLDSDIFVIYAIGSVCVENYIKKIIFKF